MSAGYEGKLELKHIDIMNYMEYNHNYGNDIMIKGEKHEEETFELNYGTCTLYRL